MVSIIVPVYNSIFYLEECIQSLLSQTVDDLEIILIDDCSTDDVMFVIEPLVAQYEGKKTIRVHRNEKNLGSSATRNLGVEMAKGEYIGFVDCDHFIAHDYIEAMLDGFNKADNIGIVMSLHTIVKTMNGKYAYIPSEFEQKNKVKRLLSPEQFAEEMWSNQLPDSVYGKIFRRFLFNKNRFRTDRLSAGYSFGVELTDLLYENDILALIIPYNQYFLRATNGFVNMRHCRTAYFMEKIVDYNHSLSLCESNKLPFTQTVRQSFLLQLLSTIRLSTKLGPNTEDAYKQLHSILKKQKNKDAQCVLNKSEYKRFLKIKYLPGLYRWINARRTYQYYFNHMHFPIEIFNLGDKLEVASISKAGSSHLKSILIYLNRGVWVLDHSTNIQHICLEHNFFKKENAVESVVRFSVYMDPFRRLVSTYQDKLRGGNPYVPYNLLGMGEKTPFRDFMVFVRKELKIENPLDMDVHIRPQVFTFDNYNSEVIVPIQYLNDFLLENGIPIPPKIVNSSRKPKDYSEFEPFRKEIMELYSCDYDILNSFKIYKPKREQSRKDE